MTRKALTPDDNPLAAAIIARGVAGGRPATPYPLHPGGGDGAGRWSWKLRGRTLRSAPRVRPPAGATDAGGCPFHQEPGLRDADTGSVMALRMTALITAPPSSGIAKRQCDKLCAFVRLHPQQHGVLALAARF